MNTAMSGYPIEPVLVTVLLSPRVQTTANPVTSLDRAMFAYNPILLLIIQFSKLFWETHTGNLRLTEIIINPIPPSETLTRSYDPKGKA